MTVMPLPEPRRADAHLPVPRPATTACVDELVARLGPDRVVVDEKRRLEASRDHYWLSPVLRDAVPDDAVADVVVRPFDEGELAVVLAVAHAHRVAVTPRGKGTGNYAQAVPLARGIVLDCTPLDGVIDVAEGWITARAGTSFTRLEAAARATGQELAMFPSTTGSSLAGFLGGGAGGTGSIENGWIWDGFVDSLAMLPCWDVPEPVDVDGDDVRPHLHAYGTTGVITAARVRLVPARRWTAVFASFSTIDDAAAAGMALLECTPRPRNLSIDDERLSTVLQAHPAMPAGRVSLRAIVAEHVVPAARRAVLGEGGALEAVLPDATSLCVSLSYNHVTLRAKRVDPSVCHVQIQGNATVERYREVRDAMPDGMVHLDAYSRDGRMGYGGLYLASYVDHATLYDGMQRLRALGVNTTDPHTWALGGHGPLDHVVAAAEEFDPSGLLNPGKLPRPSHERAA